MEKDFIALESRMEGDPVSARRFSDEAYSPMAAA